MWMRPVARSRGGMRCWGPAWSLGAHPTRGSTAARKHPDLAPVPVVVAVHPVDRRVVHHERVRRLVRRELGDDAVRELDDVPLKANPAGARAISLLGPY